MSKKFRKFRDFEYEDEFNEARNSFSDLKERRKMKRIKNALKSKNIDELMRDEDDY